MTETTSWDGLICSVTSAACVFVVVLGYVVCAVISHIREK